MRTLQKKAYGKALTYRAKSKVDCLCCELQIIPYTKTNDSISTTVGIWDTGATRSAISDTLAKKLNLFPVSMRKVHTAGGIVDSNVYYISVILPNEVQINNLLVTECKLSEPFGMLLGMDIITLGDFHISNCPNTVFTYRIPSMDELDYVKETNQARIFAEKQTPPKKRK